MSVLEITVFLPGNSELILYAQLKIIVRDENLIEHLSFIKVAIQKYLISTKREVCIVGLKTHFKK